MPHHLRVSKAWLTLFASGPKFLKSELTLQQKLAIKLSLHQKLTNCTRKVCEQRENANNVARGILRKNKISDESMWEALVAWGYNENHGRPNVALSIKEAFCKVQIDIVCRSYWKYDSI